MLLKPAILAVSLFAVADCAAQCSGSDKDLVKVEVRSKEYPAEPVLCEMVLLYCRKKGEIVTAAENENSFKLCMECDNINYLLLKSGDERYDGRDKYKPSEILNLTVYLPLKPQFVRERNQFLAGINSPARTK